MAKTGYFIDNSGIFIDAMGSQKAAALRAVGDLAVGYAKERCPVVTGRLRDSIKASVEGDELTLGSDVEYARYVELGTRKQRANPFLAPALEDHADEYRQKIIDILRGD